MARIHEGGSIMFDALAYGQPNITAQNFLAQQFENASHTLQMAGQEFVERARSLYDQFSGSLAMRTLKAAGRAFRNSWQLDEVKQLSNIGQLQFAPLKMQRFVMAEPSLRKMYHEQRVDGYSDTYIDIYPNDVEHDHYDYRRVMDGLVVVEDDGVEDQDAEIPWSATTYFDEVVEGDAELDMTEQLDVFHTWAFVRHRLEIGGEDPTSRYNASMA